MYSTFKKYFLALQDFCSEKDVVIGCRLFCIFTIAFFQETFLIAFVAISMLPVTRNNNNKKTNSKLLKKFIKFMLQNKSSRGAAIKKVNFIPE